MSKNRKSDVERFQDFFGQMGTHYDKYDKDIGGGGTSIPRRAKIQLSVAQAHFYFDIHGNYMGVKSDEFDDFTRRYKPHSR